MQTQKKCDKCKGTGKVKMTATASEFKDVIRMTAIMKRHKLSQTKLAKILGINQGTVSIWLSATANKTGNINSLYFEKLKKKGIK